MEAYADSISTCTDGLVNEDQVTEDNESGVELLVDLVGDLEDATDEDNK